MAASMEQVTLTANSTERGVAASVLANPKPQRNLAMYAFCMRSCLHARPCIITTHAFIRGIYVALTHAPACGAAGALHLLMSAGFCFGMLRMPARHQQASKHVQWSP